MQKQCTRCEIFKQLRDFGLRAASPDGYNAACTACLRAYKKAIYWASSDERAKAAARTGRNKRRRFDADPAYKRAFNLWGSTKKRTTIPCAMKIADFVPICRDALRMGSGYELDHIVPLRHPLVCGLHVPWNVRVVPTRVNQDKRNIFVPS